MSDYIQRICEEELTQSLEAVGAVQIVGPKGCGKTTTATRFARSSIDMQDPGRRDMYLETADIRPSDLLVGDNPRLIDEWQVAPWLWDAVRESVDERGGAGLYILTASNAVDGTGINTGTGRIMTLSMLPMSLYESGESNGTVSLGDLFDGKGLEDGCRADLSLDELIFAACRGGWPSAVARGKYNPSALTVARGYLYNLCRKDISGVDGVRRDETKARSLLRSYARHLSAPDSNRAILQDIRSGTDMGESAFYAYVNAFRRLYVIQDVEAWCPAIRQRSAMRVADKRQFADPSIAAAALNLTPGYFNTDLKTFGILFETLCLRDLRVYSGALGGNISYYQERYGLKADCVLHLRDGRYALINCSLESSGIDEASAHLNKIEALIREYNMAVPQAPLRLPDLKIVMTGSQYGYERPDGVLVVPVGCLRD